MLIVLFTMNSTILLALKRIVLAKMKITNGASACLFTLRELQLMSQPSFTATTTLLLMEMTVFPSDQKRFPLDLASEKMTSFEVPQDSVSFLEILAMFALESRRTLQL